MQTQVQGKTKENLLKAFAGESQARNCYNFAECVAKNNHLYGIGEIFAYTANQEKEHAEIFYNFLKSANGENIAITATYPVDNYSDIKSLIKSSAHNEFQEHRVDYPEFARIAKEEGYDEIAAKFMMIAEIERIHGERYQYLADLLDSNRLYDWEMPKKWICLNCGHSYVSDKAVAKCPVCSHDKGYFLPEELAPYTL